jgi:hypothetical protein
MHRFKKLLVAAIVLLTLFYPGYVFGTIGVLVLIILLFLVVVDLVADVYIVIAVLLDKFKGK